MSTKVILAVFTGALSMGKDRVLVGEESLARAAYWYVDQFGDSQSNVTVYKPAPSEYDHANLGKLYNIVGYSIYNADVLREWWNDGK